MNILPSVTIPGPFGTLHTPALETPPLKLPAMPDDHGKEAIRHSVGQDIADLSDTILQAIPGADIVGAALDPIRDSIVDLHAKEIRNILTPQEYDQYLEYHKIFPSSVSMARVMCFKEVKSVKELNPKSIIGSLLPTSPKTGPPLPQGLNQTWPWNK